MSRRRRSTGRLPCPSSRAWVPSRSPPGSFHSDPDASVPPELDPESDAVAAGPAPGPAAEVSDGDLTPQGRYRASITDDPDFVWRLLPAPVC